MHSPYGQQNQQMMDINNQGQFNINMENGGMGMAGSSYLRGMDNNQYNDSNADENWDNESEESETDDYKDCEERGEFIFENRAKYKGQLMKLMAMLKQTSSRYVRCVKPNTFKKPSIMQHISTIEQLRCAGVVAAVTLSRSAFPNRLENKTVRFKFSGMWDRTAFPSKATKDMDPEAKLSLDCDALLACALKCKEVRSQACQVQSCRPYCMGQVQGTIDEAHDNA